MAEQDDVPLSATVKKVLDEFLANLKSDDAVDDVAADRIDALLRKGRVPNAAEIDEALSPPEEEESL
ncbi:MAG: hypothetical protein CMH69_18505 [Nitratireductor sp.]|nr:hypothetical protein [Nitratireductor sp.]